MPSLVEQQKKTRCGGWKQAHGEEFKFAPVFKINALMLLTGEAKEYFDLWEADRDTTDAAKPYEELLSKVKDSSRRRKLDISAKENMQHGGDSMDVGADGGGSWRDDVGGGSDHEGAFAVDFKSKGKSKFKGKGDCYYCGSPDYFA